MGTQMIKAGERLLIHTPGGGGYGNPADRDPALVDADVARGLVSKQAAKEVYGRAD